MNQKISLVYLILIIVPLFFAAKQNNGTAEPGTTNILLQSKDGGKTWQDISNGLPVDAQPEDFFAGESDLYLRFKNETYRSKSNSKTPVWVKSDAPGPHCSSVAFDPFGVMDYNFDGQIFKKKPPVGTWLPTYVDFKKRLLRTIFETSGGTVLLGCESGLYKSTDKGRSWRHVSDDWVMDIIESEGVLIGRSQSGINRSADNGETWESVISEGGVGIAVERIDGGFAAITYSSAAHSRRIRISLDRGKTWNAIDEGLRPSLSISSIKQVDKYLICGHSDGIFRSSDMGKTWKLVHSRDYALKKDNGKVFKLFVAGNVLYAVARNAGC